MNARIQCSDGTLTYKLGETGITLRYAYLSQRGYYPEDLYKANQDAFKVVEKFNGAQSNLLFGVFDGHGSDGDSCSYFVRDSIEKTLKKTMAAHPDDFERAYKECFVTINKAMHKMDFDDTMSGTTAITAFFNDSEARPAPHRRRPGRCHAPALRRARARAPARVPLGELLPPHARRPPAAAQVCVANIGDSRAIIGERKGKRVIAYSLSIDQTPYRQDERERCKAAGAVVMSCDQLEGLVPFHENWGVNLGEELDNGGDPPRVWQPGKSFPGCAFTRSIGDSVAESIGVYAEPELLCKELTPEDQFLILASDGVWEFLTNQSVADMILKFADPLDASARWSPSRTGCGSSTRCAPTTSP